MFNTQNWAYTPLYPQQPQNNGIIWVQGIEAAKSYLVAPGQSVLLMDSESNVFYIKSSDPSGMPMPLRIFDYTERVQKTETGHGDYITRSEFEKALQELRDGKPAVSAIEQ